MTLNTQLREREKRNKAARIGLDKLEGKKSRERNIADCLVYCLQIWNAFRSTYVLRTIRRMKGEKEETSIKEQPQQTSVHGNCCDAIRYILIGDRAAINISPLLSRTRRKLFLVTYKWLDRYRRRRGGS